MSKTVKLETLRSRAATDAAALLAVEGYDPNGIAGAVVAGLAKRYGLEKPYLRGVADPISYAALGAANPIPAATPAKLARAVAKRRRAAGSLGRWDVLRASLLAGVGRKFSDSEIRKLAERGGVDLAVSYAGRGTRIAVPTTRGDAGVGLAERVA